MTYPINNIVLPTLHLDPIYDTTRFRCSLAMPGGKINAYVFIFSYRFVYRCRRTSKQNNDKLRSDWAHYCERFEKIYEQLRRTSKGFHKRSSLLQYYVKVVLIVNSPNSTVYPTVILQNRTARSAVGILYETTPFISITIIFKF